MESYWIKYGKENDWPLTNIAKPCGGYLSDRDWLDIYIERYIGFGYWDGDIQELLALDQETKKDIFFEGLRKAIAELKDYYGVADNG